MVDRLVVKDTGLRPEHAFSLDGFIGIKIPLTTQAYKAMLQIPRGGSIGVEFNTAFMDLYDEFDPDEQLFSEHLMSQSFHRTTVSIKNAAARLNLEVVPLGGGRVFNEYISAVNQVLATGYKLRDRFRWFNSENEALQVSDIELAMQYYHYETLAQHYYWNDRYEAIRDHVIGQRPNLLFLDPYYAVLLESERENLAAQGVSLPEQIISDGELPSIEKVTSERELVSRRMRAVVWGRITNSDKEPNYIGYWVKTGEVPVPARGLFEVFVDGQEEDGAFTGTVEDILGSSKVSGKITEGGIEFLKSYDQDTSASDVAKDLIDYRGESIDSQGFQGKFQTFGATGKFIMYEYPGPVGWLSSETALKFVA